MHVKTANGEMSFNFTRYFSTKAKRYEDRDCFGKRTSETYLFPNHKLMLDILEENSVDIDTAFKTALEDADNIVDIDVLKKCYSDWKGRDDSKVINKVKKLDRLYILKCHLVGAITVSKKMGGVAGLVITKEEYSDDSIEIFKLQRLFENQFQRIAISDNFKHCINLAKPDFDDCRNAIQIDGYLYGIKFLKKISSFIPKKADIWQDEHGILIIENDYYYAVLLPIYNSSSNDAFDIFKLGARKKDFNEWKFFKF